MPPRRGCGRGRREDDKTGPGGPAKTRDTQFGTSSGTHVKAPTKFRNCRSETRARSIYAHPVTNRSARTTQRPLTRPARNTCVYIFIQLICERLPGDITRRNLSRRKIEGLFSDTFVPRIISISFLIQSVLTIANEGVGRNCDFEYRLQNVNAKSAGKAKGFSWLREG